MPVTRILSRLRTFDPAEKVLVITEIDLDTIDQWLTWMATYASILNSSTPFDTLGRYSAPVSVYFFPMAVELPREPRFVSFIEILPSRDLDRRGVVVPGALPIPDLQAASTHAEQTTLHVHDGEPAIGWSVQPQRLPALHYLGSRSEAELRRMRRKLRCYAADGDEQRRRFRAIERDDPALADQMVKECDLLRRSLVQPGELLEPAATGGRVQELTKKDVARMLAREDPDMRAATVRWLGGADMNCW